MFGAGAAFRDGQREAIDGRRRATARGPSSWSGRAGARASSTGSRRASAATRATGPTLHRQPVAVADAQPDERPRRLGLAGRDDQLGQSRRLGRRSRTACAADESTSCSCRPSGSPTSEFNARRAAGHPAVDRPVRRRRGALHLRLGPRLPARTTGASAASCRRSARRRAGPRHDGHGQRPGRRGRGQAAGRRRRASSGVRSRRDSLELDAIPLRRPGRAPGVAGRARSRGCPAPASSTASRSPTRSGSPRWLPRHAASMPALQRATSRPRSARRWSRACSRTGSRRSSRRLPWGWASTSPTSASSSTTSGPGRPSPTTSRSAGRAGRCERAYGILLSGREDDDIAEYFIVDGVPADGAHAGDPRRLGEGRSPVTIRGLQAAVNLPYGQIEKALKLLEVDGAVATRRRPLRADVDAVDHRTSEGRAGARGPAGRAGADAGVRRHGATAGWSSWPASSTTRPPGRAATARDCGVALPRTVDEGTSGGRRVPAA